MSDAPDELPPEQTPANEPPPEDDPPVATAADAIKMAAVIGAAFTLGALPISGKRAAFSVFVGAVIAVGNLVALRAIIRALMPASDAEPGSAGGSGAAWALFAVLKMVLLFGGVWMLLTRGMVDPIPLVVGYGVLPIGITASALLPPAKPRS